MNGRKKIPVMFFVVWVIVFTGAGQTISIEAADGQYASNPIPADGAVIPGETYPEPPATPTHVYTTLFFEPGVTAVKHTGYFSEDYSKVAGRDQDANIGPPPYPTWPGLETTYYVGNPFVPPANDTLVRGTKYYWAVDETDDLGNIYSGDIWEFIIQDYKASSPNPPNEAVVLGPDVLLSWVTGYQAEEHDVYFGTSWQDVNDAPYHPIPLELLGTVTEANFLVTGLSENTWYYWRVDEVSERTPFSPGIVYKGDVWCFKTAGLIAHWKFDEGSGSIAYDSAGDNDGTIYGADWRKGAIDGALDFDGVDDYVEVPNSKDFKFSHGFTLSAWAKPILVDDRGRLITCEDYPVTDGYYLTESSDGNGEWHFCVFIGGTYALIRSDLPPNGGWQYIAAVRESNGVLKMYVDGVLQTEMLLKSGAIKHLSANLKLGTNEIASTAFFDGLIDDVRIYNRALSAAEIEELYNSVPTIGQTYHVDGVNGDNTNDGLTPETAFKTIQRGINVAENFDTVLVWPGVYKEEISFWGDAITVKSAADAAIVETDYGYAFSFFSAEESDTVLSNFVIRNSQYGIYLINGASPTLRNLTIVNNDFGISAFNGADPDISSCIFWGNYYGDLFREPIPLQAKYSCIEEGGEGEGNISIEPGFVDANGGDYHLLSERGRYWPAHDVWVLDDATSPCIDGGDPTIDPSKERMPNGARINMGAYGNSAYASMSEWPLKHDSNFDGVVNMLDFAELALEWLETIPVIPEPNVPDVTPPAPAPVIIIIGAVSSTSIMMEASEAYDESGVQYYFEALSAGGHDSGWLDEPNYTDVNLVFNTTYCYRVKARDKSANYNETIWSTSACTVTVIPPDTQPPLPDPMQWDTVLDANGYDGRPLEVYLELTGDYGATMRAIDADDQPPTGGTPTEVEYYFYCVKYPEEVGKGGFSSGWRTVADYPDETVRRTYAVRIGTSGQALQFKVKARDTSASKNETEYSDPYPAVYRLPP